MKKLEFETNKGRFVLLDVDYNSMTFIRILDIATAYLGNAELFDYKESFKLSDITEEQASFVMSKKDIAKYQGKMCSLNSVLGLNRFLESKGIHLFANPYEGILRFEFPTPYKKSEEKTFYNPYIFKL